MGRRRHDRAPDPARAGRDAAHTATTAPTGSRATATRALQRRLGNRALHSAIDAGTLPPRVGATAGLTAERAPVQHRRATVARSPHGLPAVAPRPRADRSIQRMVGINSADIHGEIGGLISDPTQLGKLTEAYTFLQHIDWAHNIVGGNVFDLGAPAFSGIGKSENLILVAHGAPGSSGGFNGTQLANRLVADKTGVPADWAGEVFITSCYSGVGVNSVVADMTTRLGALGRSGIKVTGYAGTTITHKQFDEFLFVVDPKKETAMKKISDATTLKYRALFGKWLVRMAGLKPDNLLELAAYTSALTAQAYKEIVTEASKQGLFLEPEEAEVTETS